MTAQEYIQTKLKELNVPLGLEKPANNEELIEAISKILLSKKFRKYSANPELIAHIREAIRTNVEQSKPINVMFTHGAYKLWRLEETPEVDWAELFALMYYTKWLAPICEIHEPGVWFDSFVDDLILPKLDNISLTEVETYKSSYRNLLSFLKQYQPKNFKMTITGVDEQFESPEAFYQKLEQDVEKFALKLPGGLPVVSKERAAMIELNAKPNSQQRADSLWMEKNTLLHDAYISLTKREAGYTFRPDKILAFTQPLPSGVFLAVGSTKDSIAKFWTGVGVLNTRNDSFRQGILSPNQLEKAKFTWENIALKDLNGKNFGRIRVVL
ncbi:MAG TPA: hypothetical protein VLE74_02095 [Candidatus Saccharimonadales bacterium]|nr:hypothetical protein [Candidatus Saccharimonadales bacterium]